jgi:hypothetical protein
MHKIATSLLLLFALANGQEGLGAADPCEGDWFDVQAQVILIEPVGSTLEKRSTKGIVSYLEANDVICSGDLVALPPHGSPTRVVLYQSGRSIILLPGQSFANTVTLRRYSANAARFVRELMSGIGALKPAPGRPVETVTRGGGSKLRVTNPLDTGALQRLTLDMPIVSTWRDGLPPFTCSALTSAGRVIAQTAVQQDAWCSLTGRLRNANTFVIRDAASAVLSWKIEKVSWKDVPRPEWLSRRPVAEEKVAWALWLWVEGGPAWRLQALSMLSEGSSSQFLAAYMRDNILADSQLIKSLD